MRIWSLHPKHLDTKGLVALWRETLLAKHVLEGRTKGYKNHPQLERFKKTENPVHAINQYLSVVYEDALSRGYNFSKEKIDWDFEPVKLKVTTGQVEYETTHLLNKLKTRDPQKFKELKRLEKPGLHPMFKVVKGGVEGWEVVRSE